MNGNELLREFRQQRSEHAFAELVHRYARLVFSVAKRRLNSDALAQEAAQAVFIRLARNPPDLPNDPALLGWLHRTAVHVSVDVWRAESRRRTYEQQAAAMQTETTDSVQPSNGLSLEVDEALDELAEADRTALLLRFFDGRKMAELGAILGISEDAAKMRVGRSLERLRERLAVRGIKTTAALLARYLGEQAVLSIPATLAGSILQALPTAAPVVHTAVPTWIAQIVRPRFAALLVAIIIPTALLMRSAVSPNRQQTDASNQAGAAANISAQDLGGPNLASTGATNTQPDPRALLEGVVRARSRIGSGNMEIQVVHDQTAFHPVRETNLFELRITFDGLQRRFEQTGFEYSYVGVNEEGERSRQTMEEKKMTRVEGMRAGLLTQWESRHVSAYDGTTILDYSEKDGRPVSATITSPENGGFYYLFDPRLLGLGTHLSSTLQGSLALGCAQDIKLLGEETVEGTPAWHIQVNCSTYSPEFWVSIKEPERVLKHVEGIETFVCRYSLDHPRDPLPTEVVLTMDHPSGRSTTRFTRRATEYNSVVDPESFTVKGLGMQIGVWVVDTRVSRSLGYWDGSGFSERQPKEKDHPASDAPKMEELLNLVDQEPSTEKGLEAALWIIQNTPDGDEVEKAGRVILDYHLQSTNLLALAERFEELRHRCSKPILKGLLASNPDIETRAVACLSLGLTYLEEAEFGVNKEATKEARTYLNRVLSDFMKTKKGYARHHYAKRGVQEIDNFFIGHKAPSLRGDTIGGESIDTAALNGQVTFVIFSLGSSYEYRKVLENFEKKPVTVIEISCEMKLQKTLDQLDKDKITWPVIFDGNYGPIAEAWLINHWPTTFLIDRYGIIRARDQRGPDLARAIEAALH